MAQQWSDLKDAIIARLLAIVTNPHTSVSATVFFVVKVAAMIWPNKKDMFNGIADAFISYGLVMAGDAKPKTPTQP